MAAEFNVNILPFNQSGTFSCSQYDVGRTATITLLDEEGEYIIPTGATVTINATKPSGLGFSESCSWSGSTVTVETTATMTEEAGKFPAELRITSGNTVLVSANFLFRVEESAHPDGTTDGDAESIVSQITALVNQAEAAAETAAEDAAEAASATIDELMDYLPQEVADLQSAVSTLTTNVSNASAIDDGAIGVEKLSDDVISTFQSAIPLDVLYLYGDEEEIQTNWNNRDKAKMNFRYAFVHNDTNEQKTGWCKLSLQGQTSLVNPKHNFNIQFFKDSSYRNKDKTNYYGFGKHPKYTIKANYIDYSQARNIVSARLWGDIVHSRPDMRSELSDAPNHGAVDGKPIILYMNDRYYGLYTFNMPKEDWMLGLDEDNPLTIAVGAEEGGDTNLFTVVGTRGWTVEVPDDWTTYTDETTSETTSSRDGFLAMQTFVVNSTDAEFTENLSNYFNLPSLIDYYIYSYVVCNADTFNKNQLLCSWNCGQTWYYTAYDMDETFGVTLNGTCNYDYDVMRENRLFRRLETLFASDIYSRYVELRNSIFTEEYMNREFELFFNLFPDGSREDDRTVWTGVKNKNSSDLEFFQTFIHNRLIWCDNKFEQYNPDFVACTGISLNTNSLEYDEVGDTYTLIATPTPNNQTQAIVWATSDDAVATVSNSGLVTIIGDGSCNITVTCGNYSAVCAITVDTITLPTGYTKQTCIAVNGIGFDTGYVPNANTSVKYKTDSATSANGYGRTIFGSADTSGYSFAVFNIPNHRWTINRGGSSNYETLSNLVGSVHKYYVATDGSGYIDGVLVGSSFTDGGSDTYQMTAIFSGSRYNQYNGAAKGNTALQGDSVYYLKVYENDVLVLNYVPCTDSVGTVGFYETVNGEFKTSTAFSLPS